MPCRNLFPVFFGKMLTLIGLMILANFPLNAYGQRFFHFDNENRKRATLPFDFERNLIIIPVYINGHGPFNFILDTGVSIFIITDPNLKDSIGLEGRRKITIKGLGEGKDLDAYIVTNMKVQIGKTTAPHLAGAVITRDHFHLSNYVGIPITGIIGYDFFNSFIIKVNYGTSRLRIYQPEAFNHKKYIQGRNYTPIPFTFEDNRPYIFADISLKSGKTIKTKLIIDSGAGHPLLLEADSHPAITQPQYTDSTLLGIGLNGKIWGTLGRIPGINLGKYLLENVITSFPNEDTTSTKLNDIDRNGNLGNEILKRFTVVFDYPHNQMLLKPNSFFDDPFKHNMSGLSLISDGKRYRRYFISNVVPRSPAADAGLMIDDEILSINFKPVNEMTLSEIDEILRSYEDRTLLIEYMRNDQIDMVIVKLRVII